jgi:hypothetical protein
MDGWFNANSLVLNTEKTIAMTLRTRQEGDLMKLQFKFGKTEIDYRSETKLLGIHVSEHIYWNSHLALLSLKLNKVC